MGYSPFRHAADPDADDLPSNAADCLDAMQDVERHLRDMETGVGSLLAALDSKRDSLILDAAGYTYHHAREWERIAVDAARCMDALLALAKRMRAA